MRPSRSTQPEAAATQDLDEVRRIVLEALAPYPVRVYLFGSWSRGEARRTSDVDVALLSRTALPAWLVSRLRERLEESHVPYQVDLVDLSQTDPAFRARVLEQGTLWSAPEND